LVLEDTAEVCAVTGTDQEPAATVTVDGTCTSGLPDESITLAPPVGASPVNVTLPDAEEPPVTVDGLNQNEFTVSGTAGTTVSEPCAELLL